MQFESVTAVAFGPHVEQTLEFAPGLNIVFGLNESGKSSWHAAICVGLCGMRRRGGQARENKQFAERHRPWNGDRWEVRAAVRLADGRRIELQHNLLDKVACGANDRDLGRDCSQEVIFEGAPDGSRWLGLNRRSFQAIACVRQAHILGVIDDAKLLQEDLQRAADTAGTDSTAATAIERIDQFRKEHVGSDAAPTKPLRRAIDRQQEAKSALESAHQANDDYLNQLAQLRAAQDAENMAARRVRLAESALALSQAAEVEAVLERAKELSSRLPAGAPSPRADDEALALEVSTAIANWEQRQEVRQLEGDSAAEIQRQIADLPEVPPGDREPAPEIEEAWTTVESCRRTLRIHTEHPPPKPHCPQSPDISDQELRELATTLEEAKPSLDSAIIAQHGDLVRKLKRLKQRRAWIAAAGAAAMAAGVLLIGLYFSFSLWPSLAAGIVLTLGGGLAFGASIWKLADEAVSAQGQNEAWNRWQDQISDHQKSKREACERLTTLLESRGIAVSDGLETAMSRYRDVCRERARLERQAARRPDLDSRLKAREEMERMVESALARRRETETAVRAAAEKCGVHEVGEAALAAGLRGWLERRSVTLAHHDQAIKECGELENLLAGRTLPDMERETKRLAETARQAAEEFSPDDIKGAQVDPNSKSPLMLRDVLSEAKTKSAAIAGRVEDRSLTLPCVVEAEEELQAADEEMERLRRLDETLQHTRQFLECAQDKVHRDIAPKLAKWVERWLPRVTTGRYRSVRIDPQSLEVKICGASEDWRDATRLSHGTAEQVYLLLRAALTQYLAKPGEICPLLLDDVTVQSDAPRTRAILEALHTMSQERQIILFSQEDDVLVWAESQLAEPNDRLILLSPIATQTCHD